MISETIFLFPFLFFIINKYDNLAEIKKPPPEVFYKKCCSKDFAKFIGKQRYRSGLFNNEAGLRTATLLKKRFL